MSWKLLYKVEERSIKNRRSKNVISPLEPSHHPQISRAKTRYMQNCYEVRSHQMGCDTMIAASQQVHIGQRQPKRQVNDIHGQWSLQKRWNIADVQGMNINQLSWMKHVQNLGLFSEVFNRNLNSLHQQGKTRRLRRLAFPCATCPVIYRTRRACSAWRTPTSEPTTKGIDCIGYAGPIARRNAMNNTGTVETHRSRKQGTSVVMF